MERDADAPVLEPEPEPPLPGPTAVLEPTTRVLHRVSQRLATTGLNAAEFTAMLVRDFGVRPGPWAFELYCALAYTGRTPPELLGALRPFLEAAEVPVPDLACPQLFRLCCDGAPFLGQVLQNLCSQRVFDETLDASYQPEHRWTIDQFLAMLEEPGAHRPLTTHLVVLTGSTKRKLLRLAERPLAEAEIPEELLAADTDLVARVDSQGEAFEPAVRSLLQQIQEKHPRARLKFATDRRALLNLGGFDVLFVTDPLRFWRADPTAVILYENRGGAVRSVSKGNLPFRVIAPICEHIPDPDGPVQSAFPLLGVELGTTWMGCLMEALRGPGLGPSFRSSPVVGALFGLMAKQVRERQAQPGDRGAEASAFAGWISTYSEQHHCPSLVWAIYGELARCGALRDDATLRDALWALIQPTLPTRERESWQRALEQFAKYPMCVSTALAPGLDPNSIARTHGRRTISAGALFCVHTAEPDDQWLSEAACVLLDLLLLPNRDFLFVASHHMSFHHAVLSFDGFATGLRTRLGYGVDDEAYLAFLQEVVRRGVVEPDTVRCFEAAAASHQRTLRASGVPSARKALAILQRVHPCPALEACIKSSEGAGRAGAPRRDLRPSQSAAKQPASAPVMPGKAQSWVVEGDVKAPSADAAAVDDDVPPSPEAPQSEAMGFGALLEHLSARESETGELEADAPLAERLLELTVKKQKKKRSPVSAIEAVRVAAAFGANPERVHQTLLKLAPRLSLAVPSRESTTYFDLLSKSPFVGAPDVQKLLRTSFAGLVEARPWSAEHQCLAEHVYPLCDASTRGALLHPLTLALRSGDAPKGILDLSQRALQDVPACVGRFSLALLLHFAGVTKALDEACATGRALSTNEVGLVVRGRDFARALVSAPTLVVQLTQRLSRDGASVLAAEACLNAALRLACDHPPAHGRREREAERRCWTAWARALDAGLSPCGVPEVAAELAKAVVAVLADRLTQDRALATLRLVEPVDAKSSMGALSRPEFRAATVTSFADLEVGSRILQAAMLPGLMAAIRNGGGTLNLTDMAVESAAAVGLRFETQAPLPFDEWKRAVLAASGDETDQRHVEAFLQPFRNAACALEFRRTLLAAVRESEESQTLVSAWVKALLRADKTVEVDPFVHERVLQALCTVVRGGALALPCEALITLGDRPASSQVICDLVAAAEHIEPVDSLPLLEKQLAKIKEDAVRGVGDREVRAQAQRRLAVLLGIIGKLDPVEAQAISLIADALKVTLWQRKLESADGLVGYGPVMHLLRQFAELSGRFDALRDPLVAVLRAHDDGTRLAALICMPMPRTEASS